MKKLFALCVLLPISASAIAQTDNDAFIASIKYAMPKMGQTFEILDQYLTRKCIARPSVDYLRKLSQNSGVVAAQPLPSPLFEQQMQSVLPTIKCEN